MKKIIVSCLCFLTLFTFAGCSNNDSQSTITALNNQLSRVENIVGSTNTNELADVSPYISLSSDEPYNSIQSFRALSNSNMLREEEIRHEILLMSSQLKSCTTQKYKLGNKKNKALKNINSNLSKYTCQLNETKPQVKNSVTKIKRNLSNINKINIEEATSSYVTLNNSMNERYAYLCNIYDNLEQACIILDCGCKTNENLNQETNSLDSSDETDFIIDDTTEEAENYIEKETIKNTENLEDSREKGKIKFVKNIDSYNLTNENDKQNDKNENINQSLDENQNTDTLQRYPFNPPPVNNSPYPNPPARPYPQHVNYPNNFYGNGYNYNGNRYNPNRNTDTFYSFNRNIDTYRYNPNYYNYIPLY